MHCRSASAALHIVSSLLIVRRPPIALVCALLVGSKAGPLKRSSGGPFLNSTTTTNMPFTRLASSGPLGRA